MGIGLLWLALWTPPATAAEGPVWVVEGHPDHRPLKPLVRAADRRAGVVLEPLTGDRWCLAFDTAPPERLLRRATRRLDVAPEVRLDCTVAAYPLGRGWLAYVLAPPASGIEGLLPVLVDELALYQRVLHRPFDPSSQPTRLCVSALGVADPSRISRALADEGLTVQAVYEVGGCVRP